MGYNTCRCRGPSRQPLEGLNKKSSKRNIGRPHHQCKPQGRQVGRGTTSMPSPPQHLWTVNTISHMVAGDAPNIKDCIILSPGSAILFFSHHQEPHEGLYLHEAQELAEEMTDHHLVGTTYTSAGFPYYNSRGPTSDLNVLQDEQALRLSVP